MAREIILDTETTGLDVRAGHRLIEIACIELDDFVPTGNHFHRYIHPERDIEAEALAVHGISLDSLASMPRFGDPEVCEAFLEFVADTPIIAHNAPFDRSFVNFELERALRPTIHDARWIDTMGMAKARFPGMHNSLDALCKRFRISLAEREKHGALIDCRLLAAVYLELKGGKERGLDFAPAAARPAAGIGARAADYGPRPRPLAPRSTQGERQAHLAFVMKALKDKAVWLKLGLAEDEAPAEA
jgi:DNA polymerase-3 subunit epsilon